MEVTVIPTRRELGDTYVCSIEVRLEQQEANLLEQRVGYPPTFLMSGISQPPDKLPARLRLEISAYTDPVIIHFSLAATEAAGISSKEEAMEWVKAQFATQLR